MKQTERETQLQPLQTQSYPAQRGLHKRCRTRKEKARSTRLNPISLRPFRVLQVDKITSTEHFPHFICFRAQNPGLPFMLWGLLLLLSPASTPYLFLKDWAPIMETLTTFASQKVGCARSQRSSALVPFPNILSRAGLSGLTQDSPSLEDWRFSDPTGVLSHSLPFAQELAASVQSAAKHLASPSPFTTGTCDREWC